MATYQYQEPNRASNAVARARAEGQLKNGLGIFNDRVRWWAKKPAPADTKAAPADEAKLSAAGAAAAELKDAPAAAAAPAPAASAVSIVSHDKGLLPKAASPALSFQDRVGPKADALETAGSTFVMGLDNTMTTLVVNMHAVTAPEIGMKATESEFFIKNVQGNVPLYGSLGGAGILIGVLRAGRARWREKEERERSNVWRSLNRVHSQSREFPGITEDHSVWESGNVLSETNKKKLRDAVAPYIGQGYVAHICPDGQLLVIEESMLKAIKERNDPNEKPKSPGSVSSVDRVPADEASDERAALLDESSERSEDKGIPQPARAAATPEPAFVPKRKGWRRFWDIITFQEEEYYSKNHYADRVDEWWKLHPRLGAVVSHFWRMGTTAAAISFVLAFSGMMIVGAAAFGLSAGWALGIPLLIVAPYGLAKGIIKLRDMYKKSQQAKLVSKGAEVDTGLEVTPEEMSEMKKNAAKVIRAYAVDMRFEALQRQLRDRARALHPRMVTGNSADEERFESDWHEKEQKAASAVLKAQDAWKRAITNSAVRGTSDLNKTPMPKSARDEGSYWTLDNFWDGVKSLFHMGRKAKQERMEREDYRQKLEGNGAGKPGERTLWNDVKLKALRELGIRDEKPPLQQNAKELAYTKLSGWRDFMSNNMKRIHGIAAAFNGLISAFFIQYLFQEGLHIWAPFLATGPYGIAAAIVITAIALTVARFSYKYMASKMSKDREELQGKLIELQEKTHEAEYWEQLNEAQRLANNNLRKTITGDLNYAQASSDVRKRLAFQADAMPRADQDGFFRSYDAKPPGWKGTLKKAANRFLEWVWGAETGSLVSRLLFGAAVAVVSIAVPALAWTCLALAITYSFARTYALYDRKSEKERTDDRCADMDVRISALQLEHQRLHEEHALLQEAAPEAARLKTEAQQEAQRQQIARAARQSAARPNAGLGNGMSLDSDAGDHSRQTSSDPEAISMDSSGGRARRRKSRANEDEFQSADAAAAVLVMT